MSTELENQQYIRLLSRQVIELSTRVQHLEKPLKEEWVSAAEAARLMGKKMSEDEIRTAIKNSIIAGDIQTGLLAGKHYLALPKDSRINYRVNVLEWELYMIERTYSAARHD